MKKFAIAICDSFCGYNDIEIVEGETPLAALWDLYCCRIYNRAKEEMPTTVETLKKFFPDDFIISDPIEIN